MKKEIIGRTELESSVSGNILTAGGSFSERKRTNILELLG